MSADLRQILFFCTIEALEDVVTQASDRNDPYAYQMAQFYLANRNMFELDVRLVALWIKDTRSRWKKEDHG